MKIISEGQIPVSAPWWVGKKISCNWCKAVFELEGSDEGKIEVRQDRCPNGLREIKMKCATCGTQCRYSDHGEVQRL